MNKPLQELIDMAVTEDDVIRVLENRIKELEDTVQQQSNIINTDEGVAAVYADNAKLKQKLGRYEEQVAKLKITFDQAVNLGRSTQAKLEQVKGLVEVARCPNLQCIEGAIPHRSAPGSDLEWEQCQWCAEKQAIIDGD